jgi:hypothetical protein
MTIMAVPQNMAVEYIMAAGKVICFQLRERQEPITRKYPRYINSVPPKRQVYKVFLIGYILIATPVS